MQVQRFYTVLKCGLLMAIIFILVYGSLKTLDLIDKYDHKLEIYFDKISSVLDHVNAAAISGEETMARHKAFIIDQQEKFNDPQTQTAIGLYLRGGKPFYRSILKMESTLDEATRSIELARTTTLPAATQAINTANQALGNIDAATADFQALTSDPSLMQTLHNIERGTSAFAASSEETKLILMDSREQLPKLFAAGIGTAENVQAFTGEAVTFAKRVNKPKTRLERVLGIGIEAGFRALPSVIAR